MKRRNAGFGRLPRVKPEFVHELQKFLARVEFGQETVQVLLGTAVCRLGRPRHQAVTAKKISATRLTAPNSSMSRVRTQPCRTKERTMPEAR